jgi:hypothetical protein
MMSAYLQQLAPSSYIGNCSAFQTADQLRRIQRVAYRTKQLDLAYPARLFGKTERREWEGMEAAIVAAEEHLAACQAAAQDPAVATRADELAARWRAVHAAQTAIDALFARWAELEAKRGA